MAKTDRPYVVARCVACKHERKVYGGEVPQGEVPMCEKCGMPMVAVRAASGGGAAMRGSS